MPMPFQIYCLDDPEKPGLRQRVRATHLRYMIEHKDRILFGGPLKERPGGASIGSAFVLDYDTREEVDGFLASEPYCRAGLFGTVLVHPVAIMVPERRPGFLDEELTRELAAGHDA